MHDVTPEQLRALGLTDVQAAVLAAVAVEGDTTTPAVAGRTGATRPVVSTALAVLEGLGLVQREQGRRPEPVRLSDDLSEALAGVLARRQEEDERRSADAARAVSALMRALQRRGERPRPDVRRLEPAGLTPVWQRVQGSRSVDVVARADDPLVVFGGNLGRPQRKDRLLVTGRPEQRHVDARRANGVEVRTSSADLPCLVVVDGERARVEVAADGRGGRAAWTRDLPQVSALQRLFELWWAEAG